MQYLYTGLLVLSVILSPFVSFIYLQWRRSFDAPSDLPWAGLQNKKLFPKLRAGLRELTAGRAPVDEGYEKYGRHGKPFILPTMHWPEIVLPPSHLQWLISQPESVLSGTKAFDNLVATEYVCHGPNVAAVHDFTVLRRDLTRNLGRLLPGMLDELTTSFEEDLNADTDEWQDAKVIDCIQAAVRKTANRAFIGLPLCRDKKYLSILRKWDIAFAVAVGVIQHIIPQFFKPLLAPVATLPLQFLNWQLNRMLLPIIRNRMRKPVIGEDKPEDVLQWIIDSTTQEKGAQQMSTRDIAGKAVLQNFFAVHTTTITVSIILVNILCYSSATSLLAELREEADSIMPRIIESDQLAIREMVKLDSVIRESMRVDSILGHGFQREVVAPQGLTTPDGRFLPQGSRVCLAISSRMRATDQWEQAGEFVPLRFYQPVDEHTGLRDKQYSAVHVTEDWLSFGLGRHACPGRFFAVQAMKLLLGYLLTHYDFEPLKERPKFTVISEAVVPPEDMLIKVRRRTSSAEPDGDNS